MQTNRSLAGQALLMVTVAAVLIFGMLSLAVDLGWAYFRRESAQTGADAAAAAAVRAALATSPGALTCGANGVWCGSPAGTETACPATVPGSATTSFDNGCMLAAANGYKNSGSQKVTLQANTSSSAPTSPGTPVSYWVTVRVSENTISIFGPPSRSTPLNSGARSTAAVTTAPGGGAGACIYILSPHGTDAFLAGNGSHVTTSSCGIAVNSDAGVAMHVTGGSTITSSSIKVHGGFAQDNGGSTSSTPSTGVTPVADPFASLPSLTPAGACNSGNFTNWQASPYTPGPGTYCGFSVGNGMSATMSAGTYIINGGTFSVQGGSTLTAGGGVLIYLTNGATVNFGNGASVTLAPQSSGTYQGVLFYQDRSMASPGTSFFTGGSNMHLSGSLYFPHALITVDNGNNSQVEALVAGSVSFQGGANFQQAASQSQTGLSVGGGFVVSVIE